MFDGYVCIGKITRTHGYCGDVIATLDVDYPEDFVELESVFLEYCGKLVPFFIDDASLMGKTNMKMCFADYESDKSIAEFVGAKMYLPADILPHEHSIDAQFTGYEIIDNASKNSIGIIEGIEQNPAHPLFIVRAKQKEILIPAVEQFIVHIDETNKKIHVALPEGLLDL